LCSRDCDFKDSVEGLKVRCLSSEYNKDMVENILSQSVSLERTFTNQIKVKDDKKIEVRLVTISGTWFEKELNKFAKQMNSSLPSSSFKVVIVKGTAPTLGQYLFNNNNKSSMVEECCVQNCVVCPRNVENKSGVVKSVLKENEYKVERGLTCNQGGIYVLQGACTSQYTGKTVLFGNRCFEHFKKSKNTSIYDHMRECQMCNSVKDFSVTYVENYLSRGKQGCTKCKTSYKCTSEGSEICRNGSPCTNKCCCRFPQTFDFEC